MTKKKLWHAHARHIIAAIDQVIEFQKRGDIAHDDMVYAATLRNLHTVAESTTHIPDSVKAEYPTMKWRAIKGIRNIIVHDYLGDKIDMDTVKNLIKNELPELKDVVQEMLRKFPDN
jgi:uncharacterized protein with HEPN domain